MFGDLGVDSLLDRWIDLGDFLNVGVPHTALIGGSKQTKKGYRSETDTLKFTRLVLEFYPSRSIASNDSIRVVHRR